jgi:GT2 family glycosyltransferase
MRSIALLVLNFNGASITVEGTSLLDITLPTLLEACDRYSGASEIVVIDNNSRDHSVAYIAEKYPSVRVYKAGKNDYLFSYNEVVVKNSADIIMLLNNDICLAPDALDPIVAAFTDHKVFAVGADVFLSRNGKPSDDPDSRCLRLQWYKGRLFPVDISGMIEYGLPVPHYALGGAVAFDTAKYGELGGLDRIFYPYNFEDSDIAFRAYLKDWKCCIAEGARAYHLGSKTMTALIKRDTARAVYLMNEYTFIAKNIRNVSLLFQSLLYMPWHMLRFRFGGPFNYAKAVFGFFLKLPLIMQRRASLFKVSRGESDELFFNHDIKGHIRDFMWAKVFTAANEPTKALKIVHQLFYDGGTKNKYIKRQLQALVAEIIVVLFQSKKFRKIVALHKVLFKEMLNSHCLYTIASSYRMLRSFDKAAALYEEISNDETADTMMRGLSLYHSACIMDVQNKKERSRELGARCLQFMPEHQKCKELLEAVS